jgi:hypothetical protein
MDTANNKYIDVCEQAGVRYDGIQKTAGDDGEQLVLFTDMLTGSTLALEKKNFSSPKLQAKITKHRKSYPKDLQMAAYFIDALDFIVKKYHLVPKTVITEAAHNAAITIQKFINEGKNNAKNVA